MPAQSSSSRTPLLALLAGGVFALVVWTIPNWTLFWSHVNDLPALWQLPSNRLTIIVLVLKISAPLPMMILVGSLFALCESIRSGMESGAPVPFVSQEKDLYITQQQTLPLPSLARKASPRVAPAPLASQNFLSRRQPDPITPLPPVLAAPAEVRQEEQIMLADAALAAPEAAAQETPVHPPPAEERLSEAPDVVPQQLPLLQDTGTSHQLLTIRLLKDISVSLHVPGGETIAVPLSTNAKRLQLLAYIAWRRGELIDRDKILEHVFGWGMPDEEASEEKLAERFESHKKLLRRRIREVVQTQVNEPAGQMLIDPELDPFVNNAGYWGLSGICRVEDLEAVEAAYKVIALARKEGRLVDEIPGEVKDACDQLIAAYPGDFLDLFMKKHPGEFRPFQGRSSWARRPFTQFRDYYLDAVWYSALYEWQQGQRAEQGEASGTDAPQQYYARAAERYAHYAMYACNSRFDSKVSFGKEGEYGERVGMSERAIRRCVALLGSMGKTEQVNQLWSSYNTQMRSISDHRWIPSDETLAAVEAAQSQTNAYRFAAQVAQFSTARHG